MIINLEKKFLKLNSKMGWNRDVMHTSVDNTNQEKIARIILKNIKIISKNLQRLEILKKQLKKTSNKLKETSYKQEILMIKTEMDKKLERCNTMCEKLIKQNKNRMKKLES